LLNKIGGNGIDGMNSIGNPENDVKNKNEIYKKSYEIVPFYNSIQDCITKICTFNDVFLEVYES